MRGTSERRGYQDASGGQMTVEEKVVAVGI